MKIRLFFVCAFFVCALLCRPSLLLYGLEPSNPSVEVRGSYFFPLSERVRAIYGQGWGNYEIQANQTFCTRWTLWEGVSWWNREGHSTCLHDKTEMYLLALRSGFQYRFYLTSCLHLYAGFGLAYNFLHIHDKSDFVKKHISKNSLGGIAQAGMYYYFQKRYFLDLNLEYLYQRFNFSGASHHHHVPRRDLNLNALKVGAALGILF
jgi:hypothetical protein